MDDLISRQDAIDGKISIQRTNGVEIYSDEAVPVEYLKALPSAQPEIIRCKDCGHWDTTWQNDFAPNYHYCPLVDGTRRCDFYCADAERRTDEIN